MIFYATALSSYSAKVRIVLCAKGLRFDERLPPGLTFRRLAVPYSVNY